MEGDNMKEMDPVRVTVEKEKYAREGVHKGMRGLSVSMTIPMENGWSIFRSAEKKRLLPRSVSTRTIWR